VSGAGGFLALISAAVTPVVMISACAILITGIGTKHAGLSDRVRSLAAEYRAAADPGRRHLLSQQVHAFIRRATLAWLAHCLLYLAAATFSVTVLTALFAQRQPGWGMLTLSLFTAGTVLLIPALFLELIELMLAQATLRLETVDIVADEGSG
jgi:hypothetical protein